MTIKKLSKEEDKKFSKILARLKKKEKKYTKSLKGSKKRIILD